MDYKSYCKIMLIISISFVDVKNEEIRELTTYGLVVSDMVEGIFI